MSGANACWFTTVALALLGLGGCQVGAQPASEYMPDMTRGPAYKAFAANLATRDGRTLQRPVPGTIARGRRPFHYDKGEDDATRAGRELVNPVRASPQTLRKGQALYEIYCLVCHGERGRGDGPLVGKIPPPPSYQSDRVLAFAPGRIFHVITLGGNKMPSYAAQLSPDERWLVVTYVRNTLQGLAEAEAPAGEPSGAGP